MSKIAPVVVGFEPFLKSSSRSHLLASTSLLAAISFGSLACGDDDDRRDERPRPEAARGTLELAWSIDGRADPDVCAEVGAVSFEVDVFDQGYFTGNISVPCEDFSATRELFVDDYIARSTLLDAEGFVLVNRVIEDYFLIGDGQVTRLEMDFPSTAADPMDPEQDAGAPSSDDAGVPPMNPGGDEVDAGLAGDAGLPDAAP